MEVRDLAADPELAARLALPGYKAKVERAFVLRLETFDWNCPEAHHAALHRSRHRSGGSVVHESYCLNWRPNAKRYGTGPLFRLSDKGAWRSLSATM